MFTSYYNTIVILDNTQVKISIFDNKLFINNIQSDYYDNTMLVAYDNRIIDNYTGEILLDNLGYISSEMIQVIEKVLQSLDF